MTQRPQWGIRAGKTEHVLPYTTAPIHQFLPAKLLGRIMKKRTLINCPTATLLRGMSVLVFLLIAPSAEGGEWKDIFDGDSLDPAWTVSTVLTQGAGAQPVYNAADGRLMWSYAAGTRHAQQQVLLRHDVLPAVGQAVQVRLFARDYPDGQQDFAGLAWSDSGASMKDRSGLLLFFLEPASGHLRFWYFGNGSETPSVNHSAKPELTETGTLILRLVRVGPQTVRASWSTDDETFQWLPAVHFGPVRAIGVYNGNARSESGSRWTYDDFQLLACATPDRPEDYVKTTPQWTAPDEFATEADSVGDFGWPAVTPEARPGAYWWWPGSAVTKEDLTWNLETYRKAGWGNMGVIGIYGVRGEEDRFIDVFSPEWFEMFNHAVAEGKRLGMNIDLTPSSGWRMGGPHVTPEYGEQEFAVQEGHIVARPNGARVKRAGPGGEGLAINPYSEAAVSFHLKWMDQHFAQGNVAAPRAFYYDSFENPGNWCPEFLETFRRLRGYPLEDCAEALAGRAEADEMNRVVCDYRQTLSDLLLARVEQIVRWGEEKGSGLRMQAHGAPANLLDMYAAAAIPETEVFGASIFDIPGFRRDPQWIRPDRQSDLVNRFASSAAHVAGRNVVISESFTWLRNHYHTTLSHIKCESDKLLLNGINCIYYHGICFAPQQTTWPGWLFYASTQANARNSIFRDIPALNAYITRCQSILQEGQPHNDVLLYWPVYDLWMRGGNRELRFSVHSPEWIEETACGEAGQWMIDQGYTFDYVSDSQLLSTACQDHALRTEGGAEYRTVLIPAARHITVETAQQLLRLAEAGATVLVWRTLPDDVPGWHDHPRRKQQLAELLDRISVDPDGTAAVGKGRLVVGDDLQRLLTAADVARESLVDHHLQFIRRKTAAHVSYFIVNHSAASVDAWVPIATPGRSAVLMDPMTARTGLASMRTVDGRTEVYLQMQPGETRILRIFPEKTVDGSSWPVTYARGEPVPVEGEWRVQFVEGGPVLPQEFTTDHLACWTGRGDDQADRFAGAARYTTTVNVPDAAAGGWLLDLGDVRESARVWVNGRAAGVVVAHPFRVDVTGLLRSGDNTLVVEVTNLSANRVRDLDRRGVDWKKFHDINLVDHMYQPFDASEWDLTPSGLLGPVTLSRIQREN